ncbi:glycoside hydrolase family protein [Tianweitania sediminis]|uniref:Lysozyme n=1 Tax=Tianweitania sediminis TaxID=1502156 RepID=A0A8J7QX66_9HYPH|nr:glycoside hydrolase family protein [Tianweitania sediminis]MBP0438398.1 glycoside hydrolase family protein [Tianweitania sediminis]
MAQKVSDKGLVEIASHEGIVNAPYFDSVGKLTVGIGHTASAGEPDPAQHRREFTIGEIMTIFRRDIEKFEARVRKAFTRPLTQAQFDAAVSFDFNTGGIHRASWVKKFNAGDMVGAKSAFMAWKKPKEIIERREKERDLFFDGRYSANGHANLYPADTAGKVLWSKGKRVNVLELMKGATAQPKPTPAPKPAASDIYTSRAMVQVVQRKLTALGYPLGSIDPKTGDYDGKLGKLTGDAIAAFRADNGLPAGRDIDGALVAALDTAKPRKLPREDTATDEIAKTIPEAKANRLNKNGGGIIALFAAILAFINGVIGNIGMASEYVQPLKDAVGDAPAWLWFIIIAAIAGAFYLNSKRVEEKSVQAYRDGARL